MKNINLINITKKRGFKMARRRRNSYQRIALEPELAASMLYYDKEEFNTFYQLWQNIGNDPDLAPSGQFFSFIQYINQIHNKNNTGKDLSPYEFIVQLKRLNSEEPSQTKQEQFEIWLNDVIARDTPTSFSLSEDLFDRYCWLCFKDKVQEVDKSSVPFSEKLNIRPFRFESGTTGQTFLSLNEVKEGENGGKIYTTGIPVLDSFVKPQTSNFMVIAARPGVGKSNFMLQQGLSNAMNNVPSLFISLEMTAVQVKNRIMNWYKGRKVEKHEFKKIEQEPRYQMIENNFKLMTNKTHNGEALLDYMKMSIELFGTEIIFLDYLQLVRFNTLEEWASLRKLTFELKQFAVKNNVLIVTCSQVLRDSSNYGLELTSLFGSSTIENDADIVIGIEEIGRGNLGSDDEQLAFLKILKHREGAHNKNIKVLIKYIPLKFIAN